MNKTITLGLMSGTSLDGTDAVAMAFEKDTMTYLGHVSLHFPHELRDQLASLTLPGDNEIDRMGDASVALVRHYAEAVQLLLAKTQLTPKDVNAIGVHGQTIRHRPERGFTLQLNHPALLAELTHIDVICDFRNRDIAAGGEGAPLVPAFHAKTFSSHEPRVILNLGGIANISILPPNAAQSDQPILGGDTGPANMLIDTWTQRTLGLPFDKEGAWAATGQVIPALLADCLSDPYFALPFPKSTGRERFSPAWLDHHLARHPGLAPQDVARTLVEVTARSVTDAVMRFAPNAKALILCGGGTYNQTLRQALAQHFEGDVFDTSLLGVHPMQVEAAAFAWLAERFIHRQPGNLPSVTRAAGPRILGALYPYQ